MASGLVSLGVARPYLDAAMEDAPVDLEIGGAQVVWRGIRQPFALQAQDIRIVEPEGDVIARVPEMVIGLDLGALMEGRLAPQSLELVGPEIRIVRDAGGRFRLGLGEDDELLGRLVEAVATDEAGEGVGMSALERLSVADGRVVLEDRSTDQRWEAKQTSFELVLDEGVVRGRLATSVELGQRQAAVGAEFARFEGGATIANLTFRRVVPAELVRIDPALAFLEALTTPVDGQVSLDLDRDLRPVRGVFSLAAGAGQVHLAPLIARPFDVTSLQARGEVDFVDHRLVVDSYSADLGGPQVTGSLEARTVGETVQTWVDAELVDMPVDLLGTYWPEELATSPRQWAVNNLSEGFINRATVRLHTTSGEDGLASSRLESIEGEIEAVDTAIRYMDEMPPVVGLRTTVRYGRDAMHITGTGGQVLDLGVPEARVDLNYPRDGEASADVELVIVGPVSSAIRLIDHPPLHLATRADLEPDRVAGEGSTRLRLSFPLGRNLTAHDVAVAGTSNIQNGTMARAFREHDFERVGGQLRFDGTGLQFEGTGTVAEAPLAVAWEQRFQTEPGWLRRVSLRGRLTEEQRATLGLDILDEIAGPLDVDAVVTGHGGGREALEATLDLADATVSIPGLGWEKPPGRPGGATVEVSLEDGTPVAVPAFTLTTADLDLAGAARLAAGTTEIEAAEIFRFRLGQSELRARLERLQGGGLSVSLSGPFLDATGTVADLLEAFRSGEPPAERSMEDRRLINLNVDRVALTEDREARSVNGSIMLGAGLEESVDLEAVLGAGAAVRFRSATSAGSAELDLWSSNFGALLGFLGSESRIEGGRMSISGRRSGPLGSPWQGSFLVEDYVVRQAPFLARLLAAISLVGLRDALNRDGIAFSRLEADLSLADDQLRIRDMRTAGGTLGLNFDGAMDIGSDTVRGGGTIVPVNTLNRAVGGIPLLGDILAGINGEGIFAFAYTVSGPLGEPTFTVNPLSLITPGILRDIFFDPSRMGSDSPGVSSTSPDPRLRRPWYEDD